MRNSINCTLHRILLGDQVKEDKMGGVCSSHGDIRMRIKYWLQSLKKKHSEHLGVDGG
jgi:hypothetical protein